MLVRDLPCLAVTLVTTKISPVTAMSAWLNTQELPAMFTADRDCLLRACDDSKATVRYASHRLDIDEIRLHIEGGKLPIQLAMTWNDSLSFVLAENGSIKKIEFLDVAADTKPAKGSDSGFDADVAIATGTLRQMIPALVEALGGPA